ncbi:MAG: hypothetical protein ACOCUD_05165 [Bacillota bacterium]
MSGDVSQIINPTFFRLGRIGLIFRNLLETDLHKETVLSENYRNSESIVDITRDLLDIRQTKLGTYSEDIKEESKQIDKKDGVPFYIKSDESHFIPIMRAWIGLPKVAIIVSDENAKATLYDAFDIKEETNIYTVQEVKGQEFDKALIYNIISDFKDEWDYIMANHVEKGSDLVTRYKYYFNLLYVAITRARNNLFVFERHKDTKIMETLLPRFEILEENIMDIMDLKAYDNYDETLHQAQMHFNAEDYERARTFYLRIEDRTNADICLGFIHLQKGNYQQGIETLYRYETYHEKLFTYTDNKKTLLFNLLIGHKTKAYTIDEIERLLKDRSLIKLSKHYEDSELYPSILNDTLTLLSALYDHRLYTKYNTIEERTHA